jgi:hypothetical protein
VQLGGKLAQVIYSRALSEQTRVPIAVYLREAVTDLLGKYNVKVGGKPKAAAKPK